MMIEINFRDDSYELYVVVMCMSIVLSVSLFVYEQNLWYNALVVALH